MPLPYGEVRCDVEPEETFDVVVVVDDGEELHLDATEEYAGAVGRLHSRECAAADVLERVDITFGDEWTRDGIVISGELSLEQRHPGRARGDRPRGGERDLHPAPRAGPPGAARVATTSRAPACR